ncbi:MAG: hypothetical protein WAM60_01755 [Candidatus Promineifilaceae bacterium]
MKKQDVTHTYSRENREIAVFSILLCIVFSLLSGCTPVSGEGVQNHENEPVPITRTRPVEPTATLPLTEYDPIPFGLDEVICQLDSNTFQDFDHWADELIPGVNTVDDLLTLTTIPEERQPERTGVWRGSIDDVYLVFSNGLLEAKSDPRTKLGEIVAHYGLPEKVLWKIPTELNDHPIDETFLLYPEHNAVFWESKKITRFIPNTEFRYSEFSIEEIYLGHTSSFETDQFDQYIESVWPCLE